MTKRITAPIKEQLNKAGKQIEDILSDYSTRMFARLRRVETQFEEIERSTETAIKNSDAAKKKVSDIQQTFQKELDTREAMLHIVGETHLALKQLYSIIEEGAEELSELPQKLSVIHNEIDATSRLANQIGALARGGRWDVTNVAMLAKTVELFSQSDPETIGTLMDKIDLEKWQQALISRDPKRWLEIEMAFENARQGRK